MAGFCRVVIVCIIAKIAIMQGGTGICKKKATPKKGCRETSNQNYEKGMLLLLQCCQEGFGSCQPTAEVTGIFGTAAFTGFFKEPVPIAAVVFACPIKIILFAGKG